jgi:hypothetical protein
VPDESEWYSVRCVFRASANRPWGPSDLAARESAYEERITLWLARSAAEAIERAEADAWQYAMDVEDDYLGIAQSYRLADQPGDGAEVFSLCRRSVLGPGPYLDAMFDTGTEYQRDVEDG